MSVWHLGQESLGDAVRRLGSCSSSALLVGYLICKRSQSLSGRAAARVVTGTKNPIWVKAHIDWTAREPAPTGTNGVGSRGIPQIEYFVPFGWERDSAGGRRTSKYPSNGVSDNLPKWQTQSIKPPVTWVAGTERPKEYAIEILTTAELSDFVYGRNTESVKACITDVAIWWHRFSTFSTATITEEDLVTSMLVDNGLSPSESAALFDSSQYQATRVVDLVESVANLSSVLPLLPQADNVDLESLATRIGWSHSEVEKCLSVLQGQQPQIILTGPPGTGKTFVAREIANTLTSSQSERIRLVQFHPSYGYEDFVVGIGSSVNEDDESLGFRVVDGALTELIREMGDSENRFVLIIDEINRANLHRVFGELMFAIEYRGEPVSIMHGRELVVPPNLAIIGTMNTADRSIRHLDSAMRRRFRFVEVRPNSTVLRNHYEFNGHVNELGETLFKGFQLINERLTVDLDRHHQVGHSYFMVERMSSVVLRDIFEQQLNPLIEDYFLDDSARAEDYKFETFWADA